MPAPTLHWKRKNDEGLIGKDPFHDLTEMQAQSQRSASHLQTQNIWHSHTPAETPTFKRDFTMATLTASFSASTGGLTVGFTSVDR